MEAEGMERVVQRGQAPTEPLEPLVDEPSDSKIGISGRTASLVHFYSNSPPYPVFRCHQPNILVIRTM